MTEASAPDVDEERKRIRRWAEDAARNGAPLAAFFLTYAEAKVLALTLDVRTEARVQEERTSPFLYAMQ